MATKPEWITSAQLAKGADVGEAPALLKQLAVESSLEMTEGARRIRFVISTNDVDRDNDVIDQNGWVLDAYKQNPVVLWAHSHRDLPVGRALSVGVDGNGRLTAEVEFATHEFAETVYQLYRGGFMRATSVGFRALEWTINEERRGIDFKRQELLEFSCVPVPANAHALVAASAAGVQIEPLKRWVAGVAASLGIGDDLRDAESRKSLDQLFARFDARIDAAEKFLSGLALHSEVSSEVSGEKTIGGYQECGYTSQAEGASSPMHVHDYGLYQEGDQVRGWAMQVADHTHRITAESLSRGETEASDGHVHQLMKASDVRERLASLDADPTLRVPATRAISDDDCAVELSDEKLLDIDQETLCSSISAAASQAIREMAREMTVSEINRLRGRLD